MRKYIYLSTIFFLMTSCGEDVSDIKNQGDDDIEHHDDNMTDGESSTNDKNSEIDNPILQPFNPGNHAIISQRPDYSNNDPIDNKTNDDIIEETIDFPSGSIINHEGIEVEIKPFRMYKSVISTDKVWDCIVEGGCDTFNFFSGAGEQFMSCSSKVYSCEGSPVHSMTYDGAVEFCNWMGGRLPTEAEWEYAALYDGEKLRDVLYAWGNEEPDLCVNASYERNDLDGNYSYCRCFNEKIITLPNQYNMGYQAMCKYENLVKDRTPTGLAHMSGHVAEYVSDYIEIAPNDFDRNECHLYILKGGSYLSPPEKLKIREREYFSYCGHAYPTTGEEENDYIPEATGFRCVFDVKDT